jgi:hypothetical protein
MPVEEPMVASDGLLLPHVPPPGEQLSVVERLPHIVLEPVIAPGCGLIVIV